MYMTPGSDRQGLVWLMKAKLLSEIYAILGSSAHQIKRSRECTSKIKALLQGGKHAACIGAVMLTYCCENANEHFPSSCRPLLGNAPLSYFAKDSPIRTALPQVVVSSTSGKGGSLSTSPINEKILPVRFSTNILRGHSPCKRCLI